MVGGRCCRGSAQRLFDLRSRYRISADETLPALLVDEHYEELRSVSDVTEAPADLPAGGCVRH